MKKFLSMLLVVCMMSCFIGTVAFASEDNTNREIATDVESVIVSEKSLYMSSTVDSINADLGGEHNGVTTGDKIGGTFEVPESEAGKLVKIVWFAVPINGANPNAVFELTVDGKRVLLYGDGSANAYSVGYLSKGTYRFEIHGYSDVSGSYSYAFKFYTFG